MTQNRCTVVTRSARLTVVLAACLMLVGCGGDDEVAGEQPTDPQEVITIGAQLATPGLIAGSDPAELAGAEVTLGNELAEAVLQDQPNAQVQWEPLPELESAGVSEFDLVLGQLTETAHSDQLGWVGPYVTVQPGLLVNQVSATEHTRFPEAISPTVITSGEDLADAVVCAVAGSSAAGTTLPVADQLVQLTVAECEVGMRSGRFDAIAADDLQLAGVLTDPAAQERYKLLSWSELADQDEDLQVPADLLASEGYWIGTAPEHCAKVFEGLAAAVTEGQLAAAFELLEPVTGFDLQLPQEPTDLTVRHCD